MGSYYKRGFAVLFNDPLFFSTGLYRDVLVFVFAKPSVVGGRSRVPGLVAEPAGTDIFRLVEGGHVWFYVEQRGAVEDVDVGYDQQIFGGDLQQRQYRQPDGVGPGRGPRGEDAVRPVIEKRHRCQRIFAGQVEMVQHNDVRKATEAEQSAGVFIKYFDAACFAFGRQSLDGGSRRRLKGAVDDPDGLISDFLHLRGLLFR